MAIKLVIQTSLLVNFLNTYLDLISYNTKRMYKCWSFNKITIIITSFKILTILCGTYSLKFWSRKVFEGVQSHVWSNLEKASLVHFFFSSNFLITCQKASLVHIQIVRKGKFGPDSEKKLDQTCLF